MERLKKEERIFGKRGGRIDQKIREIIVKMDEIRGGMKKTEEESTETMEGKRKKREPKNPLKKMKIDY